MLKFAIFHYERGLCFLMGLLRAKCYDKLVRWGDKHVKAQIWAKTLSDQKA